MMSPMICQHCRKELNPLTAKVEWMSNRLFLSMVETIRLVHEECQYEFTHPRTMDLMDYHDHWLPFWHLWDFIEIPKEQDWDNKQIALLIFKDYINHQQQRAKEVQNENN
jgi:hypothetical protein